MSKIVAHGHEIVRYLLVSGLALGAFGASAEASDLLDGGAQAFSILFTSVIHAVAIVGLLARREWGKWIALAVFVSDALLAVTIAIDLPSASTAGHAISAWFIAGTSVIWAGAAWAWAGDPVE